MHIGQADLLKSGIGKVEFLKALRRNSSYCSIALSPYCLKKAFTLAEVLITLAIIGVVAALTMPTLIQNHRKQVVETRLAKFYSVMNQATQMAEVEFGPKEEWDIHTSTLTGYEWYNKYLNKYIKTLKVECTDKVNNSADVYFPDGSMAVIHKYAVSFIPDLKRPDIAGINRFLFYYAPTNPQAGHKNKGFEPYSVSWDGTKAGGSGLKTNSTLGCYATSPNPAYCAKLIQLNGWKIPKDYPFKF